MNAPRIFWLLPGLTLILAACSSPNTAQRPPAAAARASSPAVMRPQAISGAWQSLNPGAGGQVQAVVLDPNIENRAYLLSDVEGMYTSTDGGASWTYSGRGLAGTDTLALAVTPGNSNVVYLGTTVGLHTSRDGGATWKLQPQLNRAGALGQLTDNPDDPGYGPGKMSIGSLAINPQNTAQVVAGLGSRRWSLVNQATVYRSSDSGATFSKVTFGAGGGNQSILQLASQVTGGSTVLYAAAGDAGLWQSRSFGAAGSWVKVTKPADAAERAEGVAVTADGRTLYAVYRDAANSANFVIYTARTADLSWKKLPFGGLPGETNNHFLTVALDPSVSGENAQRMVAANSADRNGLYEINVTWNGAASSATWQKVFFFGQRAGAQDPSLNAAFDIGWEGGIFGNRPRPLSYAYTPQSWQRRELWTTGDQTIFKTNRAQANFTTAWTPLYTSGPVQSFPQTTVNVGWTPQNTYNIVSNTIFDIPSLAPIQTYRTTGSASTVDFDADLYGQVVISSKADNGVMMSYDGGTSWENVSPMRRARSQANLLLKPTSDPNEVYALAHVSYPFDFGGAGRNGELWARTINPNSPGPGRWYFLAGGQGETYTSLGSAPNGDQTLGLPNDIYTNILSDPSDARRVFITTKNSGIFRIDDITYLWCVRIGIAACGSNLPGIRKVSDVNSNEYEGSAVIDPNNPALMWVADGPDLKKVNLNTGAVQWLRHSGKLITLSAWNNAGITWIAATQDANEVYLSRDGGFTWTRSFSRYDLTSARTPSFDFSLTQDKLELFGLAGSGNTLYAVVQVQNPENLGYGVFEITLDPNTGNKSAVRDITENLYFPKSLRTEVVTDAVSGRKYLLMSTWGAGLWRRPL